MCWVGFLSEGLLAYHFFWFWKIAWFDLFVHFLAGASFGLTGLIFYFGLVRETGQKVAPTFLQGLLVALVATIIAGGLWELFEFSIDQYWATSFSVKQLVILKTGLRDTAGDLLADTLGGVFAGLIFGLINYFFPVKLKPLEEN